MGELWSTNKNSLGQCSGLIVVISTDYLLLLPETGRPVDFITWF